MLTSLVLASALLLGDSHIEGFPFKSIEINGFRTAIVNKGKVSATTSTVLNKLRSLNVTERYAFIMVGINEIEAKETILENYSKIIDLLRKKNPVIRIYILSVLPTRLDNIRKETIESVNARIETLADNINVFYINLYPYFLSQGYLHSNMTEDKLHLTNNGYSLFKKIIENSLYPKLEYIGDEHEEK